MGSAGISNGSLRGNEIAFTVGSARYTGRVTGSRIEGTTSSGASWTATR
jgi:hypothetical protein